MSALPGMSRIVNCNGNACAFTGIFIWQEICHDSNTRFRVTVTELLATRTILMKYYTCWNQEWLNIIAIIFLSIFRRESWTLTSMFFPFSTFTFLYLYFPSPVVLCFFCICTIFTSSSLCSFLPNPFYPSLARASTRKSQKWWFLQPWWSWLCNMRCSDWYCGPVLHDKAVCSAALTGSSWTFALGRLGWRGHSITKEWVLLERFSWVEESE